ncbi:MAG: hypothetical protein ISR58_12225 [Anaerolineales bacterium]|nr:hypothetical protein [Chloroflexota bacterium]MBL6981944.1 hypothetical protein [Anaerolineales bacterium]
MKKLIPYTILILFGLLGVIYLPDLGMFDGLRATHTETTTSTITPTSTATFTPTYSPTPTASTTPTISPTPKPLDAEIFSETSYQVGGTTHFIGLIRNTGLKPFKVIRVKVEFTQDGWVVHTGIGHSPMAVVYPGQVAPFEILDREIPVWDDFDAKVNIQEYTGDKDYHDLIVSEHAARLKNTGTHEITGTLYNQGESVAGFPKIVAMYYASDGSLLAINFVSVQWAITPGESQAFRILFNDAASLDQPIASYELLVESVVVGE